VRSLRPSKRRGAKRHPSRDKSREE
jgi:hypothetical protein